MADKIEIGKRIRQARDDKKLTQQELAAVVGMNKSTIQRYETGQVDKIKLPVIMALAEKLNVNASWLSCKSDEKTTFDNITNQFDNIECLKTRKIPMLGEIACGKPIFADECHEMCIPVSDDIKADFCLKAKGDSMINAKICSGDIVFIRSTSTVDNGEIAVVIIDDEATLKRVYYDRENNIIQLVAENPAYSPMIYTGEKLNEIRILGRAVAVLSVL